jgi:rubrerythrin
MSDECNRCPWCGHEFEEISVINYCPRCGEKSAEEELIGPDDNCAYDY